jgi:hypothetical protein
MGSAPRCRGDGDGDDDDDEVNSLILVQVLSKLVNNGSRIAGIWIELTHLKKAITWLAEWLRWSVVVVDITVIEKAK